MQENMKIQDMQDKETAEQQEQKNQNSLLELSSLMDFLNHFNPKIYAKILAIGQISRNLGLNLQIHDHEFLLAGFYANISLVSMQDLAFKSDILNEKEFEIYKRHTILSSQFVKNKGLLRASEYILHHHEKPNGSGYFAKQNYPKESALINVADAFENCISLNDYRPQYTLDEALVYSLSPYQNNAFFTTLELENIEKVLVDYYNAK